ncbi:Uncharacterised protein [Vibrio cholerae]|nr:Uncharacterised protein [Vibrio cholerae]
MKYKASYWSMKLHHEFITPVTGLSKVRKPVSSKTTYGPPITVVSCNANYAN